MFTRLIPFFRRLLLRCSSRGWNKSKLHSCHLIPHSADLLNVYLILSFDFAIQLISHDTWHSSGKRSPRSLFFSSSSRRIFPVCRSSSGMVNGEIVPRARSVLFLRHCVLFTEHFAINRAMRPGASSFRTGHPAHLSARFNRLEQSFFHYFHLLSLSVREWMFVFPCVRCICDPFDASDTNYRGEKMTVKKKHLTWPNSTMVTLFTRFTRCPCCCCGCCCVWEGVNQSQSYWFHRAHAKISLLRKNNYPVSAIYEAKRGEAN